MAELPLNHECENNCRDVCIHAHRIMDSCMNQDCIEDLRVYLTRESQAALEEATGAKARCCELVHAAIEVSVIPYHTDHYTVDITFYYRITGDINSSGLRSSALCGLAVFNKRIVLCGGSGGAKSFSNRTPMPCASSLLATSLPDAIVEVVDPIILSAKVTESCDCCHHETSCPDIPAGILESFGNELALECGGKRLYVTIGQFSTVRLERDTQIQIPNCKYCIPTKECCDDPGCAEEPCDVFGRISFPVNAFFPSDCRSSGQGSVKD